MIQNYEATGNIYYYYIYIYFDSLRLLCTSPVRSLSLAVEQSHLSLITPVLLLSHYGTSCSHCQPCLKSCNQNVSVKCPHHLINRNISINQSWLLLRLYYCVSMCTTVFMCVQCVFVLQSVTSVLVVSLQVTIELLQTLCLLLQVEQRITETCSQLQNTWVTVRQDLHR